MANQGGQVDVGVAAANRLTLRDIRPSDARPNDARAAFLLLTREFTFAEIVSHAKPLTELKMIVNEAAAISQSRDGLDQLLERFSILETPSGLRYICPMHCGRSYNSVDRLRAHINADCLPYPCAAPRCYHTEPTHEGIVSHYRTCRHRDQPHAGTVFKRVDRKNRYVLGCGLCHEYFERDGIEYAKHVRDHYARDPAARWDYNINIRSLLAHPSVAGVWKELYRTFLRDTNLQLKWRKSLALEYIDWLSRNPPEDEQWRRLPIMMAHGLEYITSSMLTIPGTSGAATRASAPVNVPVSWRDQPRPPVQSPTRPFFPYHQAPAAQGPSHTRNTRPSASASASSPRTSFLSTSVPSGARPPSSHTSYSNIFQQDETYSRRPAIRSDPGGPPGRRVRWADHERPSSSTVPELDGQVFHEMAAEDEFDFIGTGAFERMDPP